MRAKATLSALCLLLANSMVSLPEAHADRIPHATNANQAVGATAPRSASSTQPSRSRAASTAQQPTGRQATHTRQSRRNERAQTSISLDGAQLVAFRGARPAGGTPILPVAATSGLSCVPFARMATGMTITGDARLWWGSAAGTYARGNAPERGSVLAFTASGGMRRGHVAVVSRVVGARIIHIDHSNWGGPGIRRGSVMRGVVVMDVSDRNDWTAVRVQVGQYSSSFGRTYPTHGFIYNRPAGTRIMTAEAPALTEVAEAMSPHAAQHLRLTSELFAE